YIYNRPGSPTVLQQTGQTNYLYNFGYVKSSNGSGPFPGAFPYVNQTTPATAYSTVGTPSSSGSTIVSISDGTSNTIFMMESNGGYLSSSGTQGWVAMNWGHAPFYANFGLCPNSTNPNCKFTPEGKG